MAIDNMSSLSRLSILLGEQTPKKRVFSDLELEEESEEPNKAYDLAKGTPKKHFKNGGFTFRGPLLGSRTNRRKSSSS